MIYLAKKIADFGCGYGDFLRRIYSHCDSVVGIELDEKCQNLLDNLGIRSKYILFYVES